MTDVARQLLAEGALAEALAEVKRAVKESPEDVRHRVFLFQLLCVDGQWQRALEQLQLIGQLDHGALLMAQMYREAIRAEVVRTQVFAGDRAPMFLGEPSDWQSLMLQSLVAFTDGRLDESDALRSEALDRAPAISGQINDQAFEWLGDSDARLGPIFEFVLGQRYCWVPVNYIREISFDAPEDLRDVVWMPATVTWENGGQSTALMPARYPETVDSDDARLKLARRTEYKVFSDNTAFGVGQRVFVSNAGEFALLDTRLIRFMTESDREPSHEQGAGA